MTLAERIAEAKEFRALWRGAEMAFAGGAQSYTIGPRTIARVDPAVAHRLFVQWDSTLSGLESGQGAGVRVFRVMLRDV